MTPLPPRSTLTDTLFPSTTLCRSGRGQADTRPSPLLCPCRLEQAGRGSIVSDRIGGGKAPGEVVESAHRRHHLVAGGKQRSRQVSTDEAVGPRQQYAHRSGPPRAPCYSLGAV